MNTLINLVLSIVLNLLSLGSNLPEANYVSNSENIQVCQEQSFKLKDLNSHYLITNEEVTQSKMRVKVETISTN